MKSLHSQQPSKTARIERAERWKPYPFYKESRVDWLGIVPEGWGIRSLKTTLRSCINGVWGDEPRGNDDDIVCIRVADFIRETFRVNISDPTIRAISRSQRDGKIIEQGDLLMEKSGGGDLQPVGAVVLYDHDIPAVNSNFIALIKVAADHDPDYLCYLHNTLYAGRINTRSIKQTTGIQNLDQSSYLDEKVAIPPFAEQRAIAAFLDRETAKIDALIAKQQRLIELLQEKRTALISHAVTKGLDPNVSIKDSGLGWLGVVPEHWETWKIAHAFQTIGSGTTPPSGEAEWYENGKIPWVQTSELRENYIHDTEKRVTRDAIKRLSTLKIFPIGSLLIAMYGATIGRLGILGIEACTNQACCVLASPTVLDVKFTFYWFYGFREVIIALSFGGGQPNIGQGEIRNIRISAPTISEQRAITAFLDRETAKIGALTAKVQAANQSLQEYRTALISAAVTGKIDVRNIRSNH